MSLAICLLSEGYEVTLYQHNFFGNELVKAADDNCLIDDNFNDDISSLVIAIADNPSIQLTSADMVGRFQTASPTNGWHSGNIIFVDGSLKWENDAGVSWQLGLDSNSLLLTVSSDYPYITNDDHEITLAESTSSNGNPFVASININSDEFARQIATDPFAGVAYASWQGAGMVFTRVAA